jgi:aryl-alcohol dehydrogenase-like predicted oxidoreductase
METRPLGRFEVSVVGIGCNNFGTRCDADRSAAVVRAALDAGVNFFDTADVYGAGASEEHLGKALGARRDEAVIATKFGGRMGDDASHQGAGRSWLRQAVDDSLRALGPDRIDLYQLHFPDQRTPLDETLDALDELVRAGKVLEIGCSNFGAALLDEAAAIAGDGAARFVSVQNHYNLLNRDPEPEVLDAAERHGMAFLPYFPLASGVLTGKYRRGEEPPAGARLSLMPAERREKALSDRTFDVVEALDKFVSARERTLLELAVSWLLSRGAVASVIAGATRPEQVVANAGAAGWLLTDDELAEIDTIVGGPPPAR